MVEAGRGFTLIETLVTIALVAIMAGFAVPLVHDLRLDRARARELDGWVQSIHLARSEALKRNAIVALCPSGDGVTCSSALDWSDGRLLFVNLDADPLAIRRSDEPVVQAWPAWHGGRITGNRSQLSFRPFGQSGVTSTFVFCDARGDRSARAVIISQSGRPRVAAEGASGEALSCP